MSVGVISMKVILSAILAVTLGVLAAISVSWIKKGETDPLEEDISHVEISFRV